VHILTRVCMLGHARAAAGQGRHLREARVEAADEGGQPHQRRCQGRGQDEEIDAVDSRRVAGRGVTCALHVYVVITLISFLG
jgi:hypothetical protein